MEPEAEITLEYRAVGKAGRVQVILKSGDASFTDKCDVTDAAARERFVERTLLQYPALPVEGLRREIDRIGAEVVSIAMSADEKSATDADDDDVVYLIRLATDPETTELFHCGERHDAEAYARVKVDDHFENWPVRSLGFKHWLRHGFHRCRGRAPGAQDFTDAIETIVSKAIHDGLAHDVFVRIASLNGVIYVDLADSAWRAVRIAPDGWSLLTGDSIPVRFVRRRGMQALPEPVRRGNVRELRRFVNVANDEQFCLLIGFLVSAFRFKGPFIVLLMIAEQGSAKSFTMKKCRALVDPNVAPVRRLPRDDRDLMISALNSWMPCFDNISHISQDMSDALCSLATGGGYGTRQLYSDDEEKLLNAVRPVMLNGIEAFATKGDLLDRAIILNLPTIPEEHRKEEADLDRDFERARPGILGALFDGVSAGLANVDKVVLTRRPRMIDFARFCVAAEPTLGWKPGTFLDAYMRNRGEGVAITLENSAIGAPVLALMESVDEWTGTSARLLDELAARHADSATRARKDWPKTPTGCAHALKRIAPALRSIGIHVNRGERKAGGKRDRLVTITKLAPGGDGVGRGRDSGPVANRPYEGGRAAPSEGNRDGWDGRDGFLHTDLDGDEPDGTQPSNYVDSSPSANTRSEASHPSQASRNPIVEAPDAGCAGRSGTDGDAAGREESMDGDLFDDAEDYEQEWREARGRQAEDPG